MHVKLETLRVNLALGVQIYVLEALEWPEIIWMKMSRLDSASHMGALDELYEYVHGLDELEEQPGESIEDCLGLGEFGHGSLAFSV